MYNNQDIFCKRNLQTVYIEADVSSFKEVVQFLTSSPEFRTPGSFGSKPTSVIKNGVKRMKKHTFKVQERSKQMNLMMMMMNCSKVALPLSSSSIYLSSTSSRFSSVEEKVVEEEKKKKGFYLHTSAAMVMPRATVPRLLPLFPMTSSSSI